MSEWQPHLAQLLAKADHAPLADAGGMSEAELLALYLFLSRIIGG